MGKNKLLGSGVREEEDFELTTSVKLFAKAPAWRYNLEFPKGKIFKTDEELAAADASGWKDHPGKVQNLPGFEGMFESD